MNKRTFLSLFLAILHGVSGLLVLMVSTWFIAACAVAPAGFNYMIPAIAVRGLALLRIASGYAHLWLGHDDVLSRTSALRLSLFQALQNKRFDTRAEGVEALAQHTQAVASVWVGWVSQQVSALILVLLSVAGALVMGLPGADALIIIGITWLLLSLYLVIFGVRHSVRKHALDNAFRFTSEHFLRTSSLWHLYQHSVIHKAPTAVPVWQATFSQELAGKWHGWYLQALAYLVLVVLLHGSDRVTFGEPLALVVPLLLLAVPDWLGRSLAVFPAFAQWKQSSQSLQSIVSLPALPNPVEAETAPVTLTNFSVPKRTQLSINVPLPSKGLCVMLGSSGAGKSSLLQAMAGSLAYQGQRSVGAQCLPQGPVVGWYYVEQSPLLINSSLRDNLYPYGGEQNDQNARYWLDRVGLAHLSDLDEWLGVGGRHLSGGERKRLVLARTALLQPRVWLIDEPFEGLDAAAQRQIATVLSELSLNALVVVATHIQPVYTVKIDRQIDLDVCRRGSSVGQRHRC